MAIPVTGWVSYVVNTEAQSTMAPSFWQTGPKIDSTSPRCGDAWREPTHWVDSSRCYPLQEERMGDRETTDIAKQIANKLDRLSPSRTTSLKTSPSGTSMVPLPTRPLVTTPMSTCALAPSTPILSAAHLTSLFLLSAGTPMAPPTSTTSAMTA
jgi:hypothetical protein